MSAPASNVDADIQAAFNGAQPPPVASNVDDDVKAAFQTPATTNTQELDLGTYNTELEEAKGNPLATSKDFYKGLARGALGTFESATAGNQKAATRETAALSERYGLTTSSPEGLAGQTVGGFLAPLPGGPVGKGMVLSSLDRPQSISAAAASPQLANVSPELRQVVSQSRGSLNSEALNRHIQAESLPVPVRLTEGQATQNPVTLSQEVNSRGTVPGLAERYNEQNGALVQNLQELRDRVGPDVFSTNPVEHGDTLIASYKAKDAAAQAAITEKYQALKDANGGNFPVDGQQFVSNADKALSSNMKRPFLPSGVRTTIDEFRDGSTPMTFENFENLRTTLAAEARKASRSGDGNAAAAVNLVREQLESLPMAGGSAKVKALADTARSAAKARFDALREDPAYNAAVNDSVTPDRFVNRFVINGARDDVATMRANLADDPTALQTMSVATLDHLRNQAVGTTGNFRQSGYNKALQGLDPKLNSLVDRETSEHLANLGEVARNVQAQPSGSFVNNSNTAVAAANMGKSIAEQAVNAKTLGIGGTLGRKFLEGRAARAAAEKSLAPGAGIRND